MRQPSAQEWGDYARPPRGYFGNHRAWLGGAATCASGLPESKNPYVGTASERSWIEGYRAQKLREAG